MSVESIDRELTAADILGANDIASERVDVPEWNGYVYVRGLTGAERDSFEAAMWDRKGKSKGSNQLNLDNVRAGLVARSVVDASGKRLFSDRQIEELGRKSASALSRLYNVAARLSGLSDSDVEEILEDFTEETPESSTTD